MKKNLKNLSFNIKREALVKIALFYPNNFITAATNLGYITIYNILNSREDTLCELFAMDYIAKSYDTKRNIKDFDIIAISISFEADIFNLVRFFKFNNIELFSKRRGKFDPLIIGGGAYLTLNPEAIAPFFDVIQIGEGEQAINEMVDEYLNNSNKDIYKENIVKLKGFYVPDRYKISYDGIYVEGRNGKPTVCRKRTVENIDDYIPSTINKLLPSHFKNTFLIEISRGCPYRCAFCATPSLSAPYRYRNPNKLLNLINKNRSFPKVGFIGSAVSDYPDLIDLIDETLIKTITLSSFRVNKVNYNILEKLKKRGLRSISIASEVANEKMWNKIDKGIDRDMIERAVKTINKALIERLKIYFIIGFPFENENDIKDIIKLINDLSHIYKGRLTASINIFIPKPQSILQWAPYPDKETIRQKIKMIKRGVSRDVIVNILGYRTGEIETILSRGNRILSEAIALSDRMNFFDALKVCNINPGIFLEELDIDKTLPWEFIECGIDNIELKNKYLNI